MKNTCEALETNKDKIEDKIEEDNSKSSNSIPQRIDSTKSALHDVDEMILQEMMQDVNKYNKDKKLALEEEEDATHSALNNAEGEEKEIKFDQE